MLHQLHSIKVNQSVVVNILIILSLVSICKIVTSGEGGAALTNSAELDQKMKLLRSHGITRDKSLTEPNR